MEKIPLLEQPVEELNRHHGALVHRQDPGGGKLPHSAAMRAVLIGLVKFIASQNLFCKRSILLGID